MCVSLDIDLKDNQLLWMIEIYSFNSFRLPLNHQGSSMITARLSSSSSFSLSVSLQYTYTYKFLIEISSNVARTHLTDAHQMHAIHLNSGSDYTSHSILLFFSTIYRVLSCYTHIYPFICRRISLIVTMTRWNFLRAWYEKKNLHRWSVK